MLNGQDQCANTSPGGVAAALTVASSTSSDARTPISNYGACVDLFAPGHGVISIDTSGNQVVTGGGSSISAPHVAGAAAMHLQAWPSNSPGQVTASITSAALPQRISYPGPGTTGRLLNVGYLYPANPLTVNVVGRSTVKFGSLCTWRATVSGGGGPFVYRWQFNWVDVLLTTADSLRTTRPNSGTIFVEASTAGQSYRGTATKFVTVTSISTDCPQ